MGANDALLYSSENGYIEAVNILLTINIGREILNEALHLATQKRHLEIIRALLGVGADPNTRNGKLPYMATSYPEQPEILRALLEAGCEFEDADILFRPSSYGYLEIVRVLLEAGVDPNDWVYDDPLSVACGEGHLEIVQLLLGAGADPNISENALPRASRRGHAEIVQMLLAAGANPNVQRQ